MIQRDRLLRPPGRNFFKKIQTSLKSNDHKLRLYPRDNYYTIEWANGDFQFMALDYFSYVNEHPEQITDWILGETQRKMVKEDLMDGREIQWRMMGAHHWNGYPRGPHKNQGAYGRGNSVTLEDYNEIRDLAGIYDPHLEINPPEVEQAIITELTRESNVRFYAIGHDHVFSLRGDNHKNHHKPVAKTSDGKEVVAMCVGSTKYAGGDLSDKIWTNPYWEEIYGYYLDKPPPFCMHSNMPIGTKPGNILTEYRISA